MNREETRDPDLVETGEWIDSLRAVLHHQGPDRAAFLLEKLTDEAQRAGVTAPFYAQYPLRQYDPARARGARELGSRHRASHPLHHSLERGCDHSACQQGIVRARRPYRQLPVGRHALRHRVRPFLARPVGQSRRRPRLHPGAFRARASTRAPSSKGGLSEQQLLNFRQETGGQGLSSYPHPWLMPEFWQFPTVSMGLGPLDGDLSGALPQISAWARHRRHRGAQGVGLHGRRRDGRAGIARRHFARRARAARQSRSSSSIAICSASTGLCAATARSCRSWKASSAAPAGTSSRCCGARTGTRCSPRTARACCASAWRNASMANTRISSRRTAPMCASSSSASIPRPPRW